MSVGNPEVTISKPPSEGLVQSSESAESSTEDESDSEDEVEAQTFQSIVKNLLSAEQKNVLRHRTGTIKKITRETTNDQIIISPFAVCGGNRVGTLRQLFHPTRENNKKKSVRFNDRPQKADPALKVRYFESSLYIVPKY